MSKDNKEQTLDEQINYAKQIVAELEQKKTTANNSLQEINTAKTTVKNTANNSLQESENSNPKEKKYPSV